MAPDVTRYEIQNRNNLLFTGYVIEKSGEPGRNRTYDPLIKSQLLYQLSYGPTG